MINLMARSTSICFLLFTVSFATAFMQADEAMDAFKVHSDKVRTIGTIRLRISVEKQLNGKPLDKHYIEWGMTPTEEIYHFKEDSGEVMGQFSGLRFKTGNRSYYNGPDSFIALQNFDGQLIDRIVPPDSPCTARIATRQKAIRFEDPYELLLFEFYTKKGGVGGRLDVLASKASSYRKTSGNDYIIAVGSRQFEIGFAPDQNGLVQACRLMENGKVIVKSTVESFENVEHFGPFPKRIKNKLVGPTGAELEIFCMVDNCHINEPIGREVLTLQLPEEVPLFNATTGQTGYWKDNEAHYFASELEAQKWQKDKSLRFAANRGAASNRYSLGFYLVVAAIGSLIAYRILRHYSHNG